LIVARTPTRGFTVPKAVALVAGLGVAAGLALTAPVHAACPSAVAERLVAARQHHDKPDGAHVGHRTGAHHRPGR
jgi:hypothetical protein